MINNYKSRREKNREVKIQGLKKNNVINHNLVMEKLKADIYVDSKSMTMKSLMLRCHNFTGIKPEEKEDKKVYCEECEFLKYNFFSGYRCVHSSNVAPSHGQWKTRKSKRVRYRYFPNIKNKDNHCLYFSKKKDLKHKG